MSKEIESIQFSIPRRDELLHTICTVEIKNPTLKVEPALNHSLHDIRMGAIKNIACGTCMKEENECMGHFGYIRLQFPVMNPMLQDSLKQIIKTFCVRCYKRECQCISKENVKKRKRSEPTYLHLKRVDTKSGLRMQCFENDIPISLRQVYAHLEKVPKEEYQEMFPQLESLTDACFIHTLPVLPTNARPPNKMDSGWKPNSLTLLYIDVVKKNTQLELLKITAHDSIVNEVHSELQDSVNILFDTNNTNRSLHQTIRQNGGIRQRIDGKTGRIRLNLMGKRVEFSARTVLSGDPNLGINEVGIPKSVAENLTIPVTVTDFNVQKIKDYNIRYVQKQNGNRIDYSINPHIQINVGDTVERSLIDGDIVAVNRQPTLHRGSMIACYVRIFNNSTIRLNYSTMPSLNADCDGDELNINVPQDIESRTELEQLMLASTNIVCSQSSVPLTGLTQDSLTGCYLLSRNILSEQDYLELLYRAGDCETFALEPRLWVKGKIYYTGLDVLSAILLSLEIDITHEIPKSNFYVKNSQVLSGVLDKSVVGKSDKSLIHVVYLVYGHKRAAELIFKLQKAVTAYLDITGFSVGIGDCIVEDHPTLHHKELDEFIKYTRVDEPQLMDAVNEITRAEAPPSVNVFNNNLYAVIKSGSKGSMINFNQITRCLGQQIVDAGRVPKHFKDRTLPHFTKYDDGLYSRGFVQNSFLKGLHPTEFFFHSMAGRIGIIDTACKTSETGYLMRRMVKSMENLVAMNDVNGDRIVKNMTTGQIVSFQYGEDNLDGTYMMRK